MAGVVAILGFIIVALFWPPWGGSILKVQWIEQPAMLRILEGEVEIYSGLNGQFMGNSDETWLNEEGFRTRNTKKLPSSDGNLISGPRLFTTASVRGILYNPFYAGIVIHRDKTYPGLHEPLISLEVFDLVQNTMKKNRSRSETLQVRPERHYPLKGIIRVCILRYAYVGTDISEWTCLLSGTKRLPKSWGMSGGWVGLLSGD